MDFDNSLGTIKFSKLEKTFYIIKEAYYDKKEDKDIPLVYVMSILFPGAYDNLKDSFAKEYMRGYQEGRKSVLEDDGK